ncbi:MAG: thiamine diphosphokinase [Bifidobacterium psychraerophilum]|uniref:thiamine diphosphokinase n=1 Tax=Bifidobacterium psychraerophilum TaxID=218140 RepID=UPI0039ECB83B
MARLQHGERGSMDTTRHGIIFGAGEYFGIRPTPLPQALVVAADGGYDAARSFGFTPDAVIGDFDSLEGDIPDNGHTVRLHPEKDDTDMLSAFKIAWQQGARIFDVYGGLGGRLDHTIGNLQLLAEVSRHGGIAFLHGADTIVTAISKGALSFPAGNVEARRMISVFSHSDTSYDVTEIGLKYELDRVRLRNDHPLGISNEFRRDTPATIRVGEGTLVITFPSEAPSPEWTGTITPSPTLGPIDDHISSLLA